MHSTQLSAAKTQIEALFNDGKNVVRLQGDLDSANRQVEQLNQTIDRLQRQQADAKGQVRW